MPKPISTPLKQHLAGEVTSICGCSTLTRRDGAQFFFTDHDQNLVISGNTYLGALGFSRTAHAADTNLTVDNMELVGLFDDESLTEVDLRAGLFDFAEIRVFLVNWNDLTMGQVPLARCYIGEVRSLPSGVFSTELRGLTQRYATGIGEVTSGDCRADLGDNRCTMPIAPPVIGRSVALATGAYYRVELVGGFSDSRRFADLMFHCTTGGTTAGTMPAYDTAIGNTTVDGSASLVATTAWTRAGVVATVSTAQNFTVSLVESRGADGWFNGGVLTWETGANAGRSMEVKAWTAAGAVSLFIPMPKAVAPGDLFRLYAGCDKRMATCADKFANAVNFVGEDGIPGPDKMATPNPGSTGATSNSFFPGALAGNAATAGSTSGSEAS